MLEKQIAERALMHIKRGWHKDDYSDAGLDIASGTCFCALGAINMASYELQGAALLQKIEERPVVQAVTERLEEILADSVPFWNDYVCRSKDEAVATFEKLVASYGE
ncbi:DUF6197 family protein [Faunimonas sp. B44]|uniref:DUF6197 family protein n=1 Tax=Faunimonas sp. B44 TaxID=3461493 RepID=UPI0040448833